VDENLDGVEGGVEAAEGGVVFLQQGGVGWVGRDLLGDLDYGIAGLIDGGEMLCANRGENGGSIGSAFFGSDEFDFVGVDVGLDLAP